MLSLRSRERGACVSSPAEPDDAVLALLLLRQATARDAQLLFPLEPRDASRRALAATTQQALGREVRDTEAALRRRLRSEGDAEQIGEQSGGCHQQECGDVAHAPVLGDLEELAGDLLELHARSSDNCLSPLESEFARALELAIGSALVQAALGDAKKPRKYELSEVRVWLLEVAVRPSALSRQLAFALFFDLSVRVATLELARAADVADTTNAPEEEKGERMQTQLFQILLEMLSKAVVVASSSRESVASRAPSSSDSGGGELYWITKALSCVLLFVRTPRGGYCADRLRALDPQIIRFFIRESGLSQLDGELLELLVFTMYAQESGASVSSAAASSKPELSRPLARFSLPQAALERFGGLELLLAHYYNSPSLATQRLLFMVFFDVACHQQQSQLKTPEATAAAALEDELWRLFQHCNLPTCVASTPTMLAASGTSRITKKLYALAPPGPTQLLSEKQLNQFVGHLRGVVRVAAKPLNCMSCC